MAVNNFKGKDLDGTFNHGEGPVIGLSISSEPEDKGLISGGEGGGKNLNVMGGGTTYVNPATPSDQKPFNLRGASYAGPQNFVPTDLGISNPFDVNKG